MRTAAPNGCDFGLKAAFTTQIVCGFSPTSQLVCKEDCSDGSAYQATARRTRVLFRYRKANENKPLAQAPQTPFDFMKVLAGIGILINEAGPWLFCDEFVNGCFEIANVMLCADERQSRATEHVGHGQQNRSHERSGISKGSSAPSEYAAASFGNEDREVRLADESINSVGALVWAVLNRAADSQGVPEHLMNLFINEMFSRFPNGIFECVALPAYGASDYGVAVRVTAAFEAYATACAHEWARFRRHISSPRLH
jgi:hypothetical protein